MLNLSKQRYTFFILLFLTCLLAFLSCKKTSPRENYNSKFAGLIDQNKTELTLHSFKDATLIRSDSGLHFSEKRIFKPVDIALDGGYLIIADANTNSLFQLDMQTKSIKQFGNKGRGPAEFYGIQKIGKNDHSYFVLESKNSRIQILDKQYQSVHIIPLKSPCPICSISASSRYLMVPVLSNKSKLVNVYTTSPPYPVTNTLMPKLVPFGEQPFILNAVLVDQSDDGRLVTTYAGLPYYFFFDEQLKHTQTIELKGNFMNKFYRNKKNRFKDLPKAEQQKRVRILTKDIAVKGQYFFISLQKYLVVIDLLTHKIISKYEFLHNETPVIPFNIAINDRYIYLADRINYRVFRVEIEKGKLRSTLEVIV